MSTTTTTRTFTRTHTATFLTDVMFGSLARLMEHLGLGSTQLSREWAPLYEPAIHAWIAEQSLATVVLECTTPGGTTHRFDFPIEYTDGSGTFRDRSSTITGYFDKISRLPSGTTWRIVCRYTSGYHSPQSGWSATSLNEPTGLAMSLGTLGRAPHATVGLRTYGS